MPIYYHASTVELTPGARLVPRLSRDNKRFRTMKNAYLSGQATLEGVLLTEWAINYKLKLNNWHLFNWTKEVLYEHIREREFPTLVGRFGSVFLWDNVLAAAWFLNEFLAEGAHLYECSTANDQSRRRFDQGHWNARQLDYTEPLWPQVQLILGDARAYYSQIPSRTPIWEILATEPVEVVKRL